MLVHSGDILTTSQLVLKGKTDKNTGRLHSHDLREGQGTIVWRFCCTWRQPSLPLPPSPDTAVNHPLQLLTASPSDGRRAITYSYSESVSCQFDLFTSFARGRPQCPLRTEKKQGGKNSGLDTDVIHRLAYPLIMLDLIIRHRASFLACREVEKEACWRGRPLNYAGCQPAAGPGRLRQVAGGGTHEAL